MQQEQRDFLQELYAKHQGVLRYAACQKGLPPEEADDAVQDTFCSFMETYIKDAREWNERQIKAALMRILRNRCMDYYRRMGRHPSISLEDFSQNGEYMRVSQFFSADVSKNLIMREELVRLREGILSMSRDMQDVAILYMVEERPLEEVCAILNVSVTTCRMRISRIRRYLTEWMEHPETAPRKRGRPKSIRQTKRTQIFEPLLETEVLME